MLGHHRKRLALLIAAATLAALVALALVLLRAGPTHAATPDSQQVTLPPPGGTAGATWTGTVPPGSNPLSDCDVGSSPSDDEKITFTVPAGLYDSATAQATFTITWTPASGDPMTSDLILTVDDPSGNEVGSADTSETTEQLTVDNPKAGTYTVHACGFINTASQPYKGTVAVVTKSRSGGPGLPSSDAHGLAFSAAVPADNQRDESEPLIEVSPDNHIYTCGPTGFSQASDYAQVSTDGGDQFHLLGTPPRGQQGIGGGGDCGLATGVQKNSQGQYQYAYAGLGPLTGFTTSTSPDSGHSIANAGPQGNGTSGESIGADRQWMTFLDDHTVLLAYNGQHPRQVEVQKSTDGGLTYGPATAASNSNVIPPGGPDFPGPMRSMPAAHTNPGAPAGAPRVAYFAWTAHDADNSYVNLAVSKDGGSTWNDCNVAKAPVDSSGSSTLQSFAVADNDDAGNIYVAYADTQQFHTHLVTLAADKLAGCTGTPVAQEPAMYPNPGASTPVQIDRDKVRTSVFPWLVAGSKPGNVAVAYYGTETDGDPNASDFKAAWDVYVDDVSGALSGSPQVGQAKATTHPIYYDQICLNGFGCSTGGDRSLGDFLSIDFNPVTDKLSVIYNDPNKLPDATGNVATPMVATQTGGPTLGGATLTTPEDRAPLRTSSADPAGDALIDYSALAPLAPPPPPNTRNEPAMDFTSASIGRELDPKTGNAVTDGGFTVTFKVANLSNGALSTALADTNGSSLLWVWKFANGYQHNAVSARYDGSTFTFAFDPYTTDTAGCGGGKCVIYPGSTALTGKVDQATGTIQVNVPRTLLKELAGPTGPGQRPVEQKAAPGTRFYDGTAFSLSSFTPDAGVDQSFLYPADNTPAMDFLLPGLGNGAQSRPGVVSPTPGAGVAANRPPRSCLDRLAPRTTLKLSGFKRLRGARLRFSGRSSDVLCTGKISSRRGNRVYLSIAKVGRNRCQFMNARGRLTPLRSCRRPILLRARGGSPRWTRTISARHLPNGNYRAVVRAIDRAGNKERPNKRRNVIRFVLRR
jgi:hypothetical protein